jgi:hypothetical protein
MCKVIQVAFSYHAASVFIKFVWACYLQYHALITKKCKKINKKKALNPKKIIFFRLLGAIFFRKTALLSNHFFALFSYQSMVLQLASAKKMKKKLAA